ncbi:MAG: hypothetical protein IJZ20_00390, partial [Clostridia bacterium]|nr:hypothetical protein [Clostridia bacterium]
MKNSLNFLWKTAFDRFYCPKTKLFYEFVTDRQGKAWDGLPTVSEIEEAYPNPCGWGTGMEDGVMNNSTAIDVLISAHNIGVTGVEDKIKEMISGLLSCQFNDKNYGFVARSVSPYDGKSHYIESSRDQYTQFVYSLMRYYSSDLCDDGTKERIRNALVAVSEKCKREVTPENDFHMLREDASVGKVNKMWGDIGAHERLRLPMFYLAAYKASGEDEWQALYKKYRDEALEKSLAFDKDKSRLYCSLQMMCSLRAVYDYDDDED